ncbi:MAG TPA: type II secretion system F family protein [Abditibacteriaceae bacterium]|jgi:type II secretory pathway component PulF
MPTFAYRARTKSGEQVAGTREAADGRAALEELRAAELFVTKIEPQPQSTVENDRTTELRSQPLLYANSKDVSLFFRQMHSMLDAGTGLVAALKTMSEHAPTPSLRRASEQMQQQVVRGHPLSEQMRAFPGLFSELMIGMIAAGESGGFLDRMCARLADYAERDYELQQTVKRETWYPKLLVICAICIPAAVPAVLAWNGGGNGLAVYLRTVFPPFLFLAILVYGFKIAARSWGVFGHNGSIRTAVDGAKFTIPIVSKVSRALASAKFCRALGALYAAGMGAGKMIDVAAAACGNAAFAERVRRAIPLVQNGTEMTAALQSTGQFPPVALQMMHTGEASGRIDEQLSKVADFLEADAETAVKQAVKAMSILIYLAVAAYIGMTVISQWVATVSGVVDGGNAWAE